MAVCTIEIPQVTELHGGTIALENETRAGQDGVTATWTLPAAGPS